MSSSCALSFKLRPIKIVSMEHSSSKLHSQCTRMMLAELFRICTFTKLWQAPRSFLWLTGEDVELPRATARSFREQLAD